MVTSRGSRVCPAALRRYDMTMTQINPPADRRGLRISVASTGPRRTVWSRGWLFATAGAHAVILATAFGFTPHPVDPVPEVAIEMVEVPAESPKKPEAEPDIKPVVRDYSGVEEAPPEPPVQAPRAVPPPEPAAVASVPPTPQPVRLPLHSVISRAAPRRAPVEQPRRTPTRPQAEQPAQSLNFSANIRDAVQAAIRCPAAARMMGQSGKSSVAFDYRDGVIVGEVAIVRSSGVPGLDNAALTAVRNAHYPQAPPDSTNRVLHLLVWVEETCGI